MYKYVLFQVTRRGCGTLRERERERERNDVQARKHLIQTVDCQDSGLRNDDAFFKIGLPPR